MSAEAPLAEVFASFQGEGPLVGVYQLFVRVRGCDLECLYCDTQAARETAGPCRVERETASGVWEVLGNPFTAERVLHEFVLPMVASRPHSLALTGGEPLLYPEFVRELSGLSEGCGVPLYLETGGHRPKELEQVVDRVRYVSLDCKLPGTLATPVAGAVFAESYAVAQGRLVAVKMVVARETSETEVGEACRALAAVSAEGPVVLQPVTPLPGGPMAPRAEQLLRLQQAAAVHIRDVRVVPQCHRALGVL